MLSLAQTIKDLRNNISNIFNTMAPKTYVDKKVADLVNGAPAQLDTLQELSRALNNDKDFGTTVNNAIAKKLDSAGGTITGNLTVNGALTAKASTAGTADNAKYVEWGNIGNKPATATRWPAWDEVTGKPSLATRDGDTIYTNNWFRSRGNTGWYSESYGGGWYIEDTTWIRAYGNKNVYTAGTIRADGGFEGTLRGNVTGSAGSVAWGNVSGKPSTFTPSGHGHGWGEISGKPGNIVVVESWDAATGVLKLKTV